MKNNFKKLKSHFLMLAIIKSAICGVAVALIAVSAVFLGFKLSAKILNPVFYVIIALAAFAAVGALAFLILRPTDKSVARALDKDYDLNERVQTSLEFENDKGVISAMQRDDAEEKLSGLKLKRPSFKKNWHYLALAVLAAAAIIVSAIIPARTVPAEVLPQDRPYILTEIQRQTILELIDEVNAADLSDELKSGAVAPLNGLLDENSGLPTAQTVGEMNIMVDEAITALSGVLEGGLSYAPLSVQMGSAGYVYVVRALRRGAAVYADRPLITHENFVDFTQVMDDLVDSTVSVNLNQYYEKLTETESGSEENEETTETTDSVAVLRAKLAEIANGMAAALDRSEFNEQEKLYAALDSFAGDINKVSSSETANTDENLKAALQSAINDSALIIGEALAPQTYRLGINRYIDIRLWKAFDMEIKPIPARFTDSYEYDENGSLGPNTKPGEGENQEGGYGGGGSKFGSDDKVFDPYTGEYVPYGELMERYYAIAQEYLNTDNLTEEQKAAVREYFQVLYSGLDE